MKTTTFLMVSVSLTLAAFVVLKIQDRPATDYHYVQMQESENEVLEAQFIYSTPDETKTQRIPIENKNKLVESDKLDKELSDYNEQLSVIDPTSVPFEPEQIELSTSNLTHHYDELFASEYDESEWGATMENAFFDRFDSEQISESLVLMAKCQATICKFDIEHESFEAEERFMNSMRNQKNLELSLENGYLYRSVSAQGIPRTQYYLLRSKI